MPVNRSNLLSHPWLLSHSTLILVIQYNSYISLLVRRRIFFCLNLLAVDLNEYNAMAPHLLCLAYKSFLRLGLTVPMWLLQKAARAAATVFPRGRCTSCRPVAAAWAQRGLDRPERTAPSSSSRSNELESGRVADLLKRNSQLDVPLLEKGAPVEKDQWTPLNWPYRRCLPDSHGIYSKSCWF